MGLVYKIHRAVNIPNRAVGRGNPIRRARYPFSAMCVGDAFLVPVGDIGTDFCVGSPGQSKVHAAALEYGRRKGWKFRADRQIDGGVRVERIA